MMRTCWWALAVTAALGCSPEATPGTDARDPVTITATRDPAPPPPTPPAVSASTVTSALPPAPPKPPEPPPFTLMELSPAQGELMPLLRAQAERAKARKLVPIAEFYADWCPPCRELARNLDDPQMREALRGTLIVKLNMDDWHDKLKGTPFHPVKSIPRFYLLGDDGKPNGQMLDGDRWGKSTVPNMSAALAKLLGR